MADIQTLLEQRTEVWTRRDPAALAAGYADDAVVTSPMFPRAEGRTAIELSFASLFRVFPDWDITFEDPCITGNRAMQQCKVRATQKGDFMGIPGSGRRIEFDCVLIFDFQDGLITRERRIYDFTGMLIQLGVLRGKPAV
ncbi:MAG TPA: ester cyclase [Vicinamibacterales bacterium]|nr:ester cyclase [Vicinamibacterales bacterium]